MKVSLEICFTKKKIIARLEGIQRKAHYYKNPFLVKVESELLADYYRIIHQEEVLWFQKSRVQWLTFGDKNTKILHLTTITRRHKNKVMALKVNTVWCMDQLLLKEHAIDYYRTLFSSLPNANSGTLEDN